MFRRTFLLRAFSLIPGFIFPNALFALPKDASDKVIKNSGLSEFTSAQVYDLEAERVLYAHNPLKALPIASVVKALTASYALETIGATYRFSTEIYSDGAIDNGIIKGNLYLVGGADPTLNTDDLAELVKKLKEKGLKEVKGRFIFDSNILPDVHFIDETQLPQESYNPGFSGLNLNGNRILFQWQKSKNKLSLNLNARGQKNGASAKNISINASDKLANIYNYSLDTKGGLERWLISKSFLKKNGGRWLPVRLSADYTGHVFRDLCAQKGIILKSGEKGICVKSKSRLLAIHKSASLSSIIKNMLKKSTNVTAEIIGMFVPRFWGIKVNSLSDSGAIMARWLKNSSPIERVLLNNHSGLSIETRISAFDFIKFLRRPESIQNLSKLMKQYPIYGSDKESYKMSDVEIFAKTGTMHFNRGLAGYICCEGVPKAAFAIFSADLSRKEAVKKYEQANPKGSKNWLRRAKAQERFLVESWSKYYVENRIIS